MGAAANDSHALRDSLGDEQPVNRVAMDGNEVLPAGVGLPRPEKVRGVRPILGDRKIYASAKLLYRCGDPCAGLGDSVPSLLSSQTRQLPTDESATVTLSFHHC